MKPLRAVQKRLLAFHRDTRGAIAILVVLTIWCLVALLGLVWNTIEESRQRTAVQTAADSAAHAAGVWMARTGNSINAQNMVICQDGSTESIWAAITPTDQALSSRFSNEIARATQMMQQQGLQNLQAQLQRQLAQIAADYQSTGDAISTLTAGNGANYASPTEQLTFTNQLRQANSVRNWVFNTYVNGVAPPVLDPAAPPRPGPPGPNGEGLAQVLTEWQPTANEKAILQYIINFIGSTEKPYQTAYERQTSYATTVDVHGNMAAHESQIYAAELAMVQAIPATIEAQRQQLSDFYHFDITLATLKNSPGNSGPSPVVAPYVPASTVPPVTGYTDSIRTEYAAQAAAAGLPPVITIDGVNPNSDLSNLTSSPADKAMIWHPDLLAAVPANLLAQYPTLKPSYTVSGGFPGGWGHTFAMPLEQYFLQRVNNDMQEIDRTFMTPLDQARSVTLANTIRQMLGVPNNGNINITDLPTTIPDDQREPVPPLPPNQTQPAPPPPPPPPPRYDPIFVLPRLTAPVNASAAYRTQVALYNTNGARFTADVRRLRTLIISYTEYFQYFVTPFAQQTWETNVNNQAALVLETLGHNGQFMVLSTYGLRPLPVWAKAGMFDSAEATIEDHVMTISMASLVQTIAGGLANANPGGPGGGILDQTALFAAYSGQAAQVADAILRPAAHQIAVDIANEWVNRPWGYEITPPPVAVPPSLGVLPFERKLEFTVMAAARQTDASAPHLILPAIFGGDSTPLVAYSQGEMFNWMEFNATDGAQPYDQVNTVGEISYRVGNYTFNNFVGSPRGWRMASMGGWEWRSRLSLSDAMDPFTHPVTGVSYNMLQQNAELLQYFQDAGVTHGSSGALDELNLH